jgi:HemY protein
MIRGLFKFSKTIFFMLCFCLLMLASAGLGLLIVEEPGYVLINFNGWVIQMTLWALLVMIVCPVLVFLFTLYFLLKIKGVGRAFDHKFERGLQAWLEHDYKKAVKLFNKDKSGRLASWVSPLLAADSHTKLQQFEQAETALDDLKITHSSLQSLITKEQMLMAKAQGDMDKVWLLGETQLKKRPTDVQLIELMFEACLNDVEKLMLMLKKLPDYALYLPEPALYAHANALMSVDNFEAQACKEYKTAVTSWWARLNKQYKSKPAFISLQFVLLIKVGEQEAAWKLIKNALKKEWNDELLPLIGQLEDNDKHLAHIERWLVDHQENANLFAIAGHICEHQKLWGKARDYYWQAISIEPQRLHERLALLKLVNKDVISVEQKSQLLLGLHEHH